MTIHAGIINRGDSFRRKRSRSNSLANSPMSPNQSPSMSQSSRSFVTSYRVHMLGGPGVGKTALLEQFSTSENIDAYDDKGLYNSSFGLKHRQTPYPFTLRSLRQFGWGRPAVADSEHKVKLNQSTALCPCRCRFRMRSDVSTFYRTYLLSSYMRITHSLRPASDTPKQIHAIEPAVEQTVKVILNGAESELKFVTGQKGSKVTCTLYSRQIA